MGIPIIIPKKGTGFINYGSGLLRLIAKSCMTLLGGSWGLSKSVTDGDN